MTDTHFHTSLKFTFNEEQRVTSTSGKTLNADILGMTRICLNSNLLHNNLIRVHPKITSQISPKFSFFF